ncbi:hypothetical protein [Streptomyces flavofungini]|uniref:Lipoprotein n=1 Tax=Streptomyces flavofungini TaxID=68200 RepID=A0ABS0WZH6_9ACTN|nr:hypothetical protein [Streptomyces flavofungini]MBJ3806254.1 hypothetical protein [Streptomyces flavofungini]GHC46337.1 hypothetical protein GCM10010349_09100 [Streptomyces flavofungini]
MRITMRASVLAAPLALATLTGCGMSDDKSDGVPSAGTSTSHDAVETMKKTSSGIYDLIGVKGKASDNDPGVTECSGKDSKKYFRIYHPWSFSPASASDLAEAMARLKRELPKHGWKIVAYGPNTSKNKSVEMTADHDKKKVSVTVVNMSKSDPPILSLNLVSGCYQVPDGQKVDLYP